VDNETYLPLEPEASSELSPAPATPLPRWEETTEQWGTEPGRWGEPEQDGEGA
jgi:hypothetical protein